jgi:hypothetical protein
VIAIRANLAAVTEAGCLLEAAATKAVMVTEQTARGGGRHAFLPLSAQRIAAP